LYRANLQDATQLSPGDLGLDRLPDYGCQPPPSALNTPI
jgi:hypothetical protein